METKLRATPKNVEQLERIFQEAPLRVTIFSNAIDRAKLQFEHERTF